MFEQMHETMLGCTKKLFRIEAKMRQGSYHESIHKMMLKVEPETRQDSYKESLHSPLCGGRLSLYESCSDRYSSRF
jgi:hypothetical protein